MEREFTETLKKSTPPMKFTEIRYNSISISSSNIISIWNEIIFIFQILIYSQYEFEGEAENVFLSNLKAETRYRRARDSNKFMCALEINWFNGANLVTFEKKL